MSRLTDLIAKAKAKDSQLGADLEREFKALSTRLAFGLNFERHSPEAVELPLRPMRKGDKVRVLPPRGSVKKGDQRLWQVKTIHKAKKTAELELMGVERAETQTVALDDLVVVAEFRDTIYPGLVSTGKVERGDDKPFHTVINGENYHVLKALTYTHRGKVDAIYIDPPYNTGAKDWKYNNDYVESDDQYRHSKWLAMMERRLLVAKELLNPADSVLIVTIDEKEYLRLGLLLEQTFPEGRLQMITSVISSQASIRAGAFSRCEEFIFFVSIGAAAVGKSTDDMLNEGQSETKSQLWFQYVRTGKGQIREAREGLFFPIFISPNDGRIVSIGDAIPLDVDKSTIAVPEGLAVIWPQRADGREGYWRTSPPNARARLEKGLLRLGRSSKASSGWSVLTVNSGTEERIKKGEVAVESRNPDGSANLIELFGNELRSPKTVWNKVSHNAGWHGSKLLAGMLPRREFPFPKSLFAVEDALRFFISKKPDAIILDFFSGSGTTAHAVMRLNKQDGGSRQCISVTNNEVAADEQKALREQGLCPGDAEWEKHGICDYITKPRVAAAITGKTPSGEPIKGDYKFTDEFPMAEGFEANAEFFTLTYEARNAVNHNLAFARIAPLLWLRAGAQGRRINKLPSKGWALADTYGLLSEVDQATPFMQALEQALASSHTLCLAYLVTDDDRRFQALAQQLPKETQIYF
ncbi:MAG: site-specific DNA-methyltransferase [Burkholderiales bacterium]|nr:site-specific DNA-methyltransferase [Burkholderiales bacterium]MCA3162152.1 site-specific DNA-methyltransferase [Burkholderiales bacterium]MCA3164789.1 site-specific DNA-methyltransferase [Burkholderiales bacterium]MCA3166894.1 site-specific DNA-methyltransferase [Burkholderiales bacterium]MCA3170494.1 site-specific DNA-methyltransferase [Burkholderiales bacterium]